MAAVKNAITRPTYNELRDALQGMVDVWNEASTSYEDTVAGDFSLRRGQEVLDRCSLTDADEGEDA